MGIIRKLIKKAEQRPLPGGMVDIHCHILPGLDDGAQSMQDSIAMAELAVADGIEEVIATPHLNGDLYDFKKVLSLTRSLNQVLQEKNIPLVVYPGGEVSIIFKPNQFSGFRLNNGNWVLLEFCHTHLPPHAGELIQQYVDAGLKVIISHPERNPSVLKHPDLLRLLRTGNVLVQITAASLTGDFGIEVQRCALYLLKNKFIDFIATDAHSPVWRRPMLSAAFRVAERYIGYTEAVRLVRDNPRRILVHGRPGTTIQEKACGIAV